MKKRPTTKRAVITAAFLTVVGGGATVATQALKPNECAMRVWTPVPDGCVRVLPQTNKLRPPIVTIPAIGEHFPKAEAQGAGCVEVQCAEPKP